MTSRFVLWTVTFGSQLDDAASLRLGDAAVERVFSFLDAAGVHYSWAGYQALAQQAVKTLGTVTFGSQLNDADLLRLGDAVEQGFSFLDAAGVHYSSAGYQALAQQAKKTLGTVTIGSRLNDAASLRLGDAVEQGFSFLDAAGVHYSSAGYQALAQQAVKALGTMTIGSRLNDAASLRLGDAAFEPGISFLDTANVHYSPAGYQALAEQVVKALAQ